MTSYRILSFILFCLVFATSGIFSHSLRAADSERPNILFFITDDESWIERSAYGLSTLSTPNFDRVAEQGVLFTRAYTSAPSCAPSRASVLTGRHFWQLKQGAFIQAWLPEEFSIFTGVLETGGYHVGYTGKGWGPGVHNKDSHPAGMIGKPYTRPRTPDNPNHISGIDYAKAFNRFLQDRKEDQPFFFWAGTSEPHAPYDSENYRRLESEFDLPLEDVPLDPYQEDNRSNHRKRANYLFEITYADQHLGRMLDELKENGELEDTLVVVTSDNGTPIQQNGTLRGKASPYDLGVHVPMAIMWPDRVPGGREVTDFVNFADLAPTFLNAAGLEVPEKMTGRNILPLLESDESGRINPDRNFVVTGLEWHGEFDPESRSARAIRTDRYAYIERFPNVDEDGHPLGNEELTKPYKREFYDMKKDPWQRRNRAGDPEYTDHLQRLAERLERYGRKTGDPRFTGDMNIFRRTRSFVQERKRKGYPGGGEVPFPTD